MPFKSKAQQRFMFAAESQGKLKPGTARKWAHETKDMKKLPEHVKKAAFEAALFDELDKLAAFKEFSRTIDHLSPPAFDRVHGGHNGIKTRQQLRDGTAKAIRELRNGTSVNPSKEKGIARLGMKAFSHVAKNATHGNTRTFKVFKKGLSSLNDKFDAVAKTNPHLAANVYHKGQGFDTLRAKMKAV